MTVVVLSKTIVADLSEKADVARGFVPCVFEPQDAFIERHHIKGSRFLTPTTKRSAFPRIFAKPKCLQFFRKPGIFDVGSYLCNRVNVVRWPHVGSPLVGD